MCSNKIPPSYEYLSDLISYSPDTGNFYWKKNISPRARQGQRAGSTNHQGYVVVGINRIYYQAHRLAFLLMNKKYPDEHEIVDHINGNPSDNRWENIRLVTHEENMQNMHRPMTSNKSSGLLGVTQGSTQQKWRAFISVNGKSKYLGYFNSKEDAHKAYLDAKRKLHKGCSI